MEIEDEIRGNNIKDEVRKLYLLEREWISGYVIQQIQHMNYSNVQVRL
jgi:hypothetical protein